MAFRNTCTAFDGDVFIDPDCADGKIRISWTNGSVKAEFTADFTDKSFRVTEVTGDNEAVIFCQN
jgi:hypothetical protein